MACQPRCWELRGCDGIMGLTAPMSEECPHSRSDCYNPCPSECHYTACARPTHKMATDINLILDDTVDRFSAVKQTCYMCEFFLRHAPRVGEVDRSQTAVPQAAICDSETEVSIHCF